MHAPGRPSVVVAGFLADGLGLGEAARGYAEALRTSGCDVALHVIDVAGRLPRTGDAAADMPAGLPLVGADAEADAVVLCANPPEMHAWRAQRRDLPAGRVNIGAWAWEVDPVPPDWPEAADRLDEIWVCSPYVGDLIRPAVDVDVARIVPPTRPAVAPATTSPLLDPERPTFVTFFDAFSAVRRKNPVGAIDAFRRAFRPGEARLVVKAWNAHADEAGMADLRAAAADGGDVVLVEEWLPRPELTALLAGAAAFVSLHRAEGHGLALFEALALGVPVVCTGVTGSADVLRGKAELVRATRAPVGPGAHPYPADAWWYEPDLDHAAALLRRVLDDPVEAKQQAAVGAAFVRRDLSPEAIGERARARVDRLLAAHGDRDPRRPLRPRATVVLHATAPWPTVEPVLAAVGASPAVDVVIATSGRDVLPDRHRPPGVRRILADSVSPFALRRAGLCAADGELVLVTEDHCRPAPGWAEAYIAAHDDSDALLLCGPIENGSRASAADWANYLVNFVAFAPPVSQVPGSRCPTIANCAVDRGVLDDPALAEPGGFERDLVPRLWQAGESVLVPDAVVAHHQPARGAAHVRRHFDDCRTAGEFDRGRPGAPRRPLRLRWLRDTARETLRDVSSSVAPRHHLHGPHTKASVWLRAIALARAAGLAVGSRWGAGRSAERLD